MKKRILSLLLTLVMILGMIPATTLTASAATLPEITGLHRGVLADGESPNMVYWDAVNGVEKYEVKVTQGTTTKTKIVNDRCASWSEIFYGGSWSIIKDKTFTVEVTGGYSHGNLFVYETNTATLNVSAERQQIATASITDYSIVRGKTYIEDLWMDGRIDPDLRYSADSFDALDAWADISGYPKFKLVDAPAWIQLWSNFQDDGWAYGDVTISFDPPADCTAGKYEFWIAVATSDTDGLLIPFKLPVGAYQGEDTQYWIQNMSIESPNAPEYWDVWEAVNAFGYLNATLIQGKTGTTYVGEDAEEILKYTQKVHAADEYYNFRPLVIRLQNDDGQVVGSKDVITVGRYRYHYSSETTTFRNPAAWVIESDVYYDENIKVYLDGKLQDVVVEEKSVEYSSTVKTAQWEFYGPWIYVYDEKPEIKSVLVNGTSVADGGTFTANSGSVAIKTTYDSVLSQALQDYGCSVKQLSAYYLNGEKINVAALTPVSNGNGTSTKTYNRTLNSGDELKVESWLEVTWPDGSKDRVDEHTVTAMCVGVDFGSISPTPTSMELISKYTDLGTMDLGSAATNIDFKAFPQKLSAAAIADGWTTGRSISVTRDSVEIYSKTYASNEVFGWNLKDNIDEGGTYVITLRVFAQKGDQIMEKTHKFRVYVKGSTIKTIALTGVGTPVIGKAPSTINTVKSNTDGVVVKKVIWNYWTSEMGGNWFVMPSGSKFEAGKRYAVEIELQTADGYSFTANKSDMTVYINGEKAGKSVNYDSNKFSAELEFESITTPVFTTQPVGGKAPYGGTYTVNWATNFTPVKIVVGEYNFRGSIVKGTEYSGDLTSIALKPNTYGYAIIAYYNDDYAAYSNSFTITEAPIVDIKTVDVFIEAPVDGNKPSYDAYVPADAGYVIHDRDDFGYTNGMMWEKHEGGTTTTMTASDKFEAGKSYTFTVLIEPKTGYEFYYAEGSTSTEPDVTVTVNGEPVKCNKDSSWLIVQYTFTIKGTTLTGSTSGGVKVAVENLKNSGTLMVAQYDGGKMVDVQTKTVSADGTYTMNELTHKTGCTYKAMLVNSTTYAPLCAADDF